jgi:hypothetical protein
MGTGPPVGLPATAGRPMPSTKPANTTTMLAAAVITRVVAAPPAGDRRGVVAGAVVVLADAGQQEHLVVPQDEARTDFEAAAVGKVRPWSAPTGPRHGSSNTEPLSDHPRSMICLPTPAWAATASVLSLR